MKAELGALLVGVLVAVLLAAAYFAPPYLGVQVDPAKVLAVGVILTAGASLAALVYSISNRPAPVHGGRITTISPLNEDPVKRFIALFNDPDATTVTVTATPGMSTSEILSRHSETLKDPEKCADKRIVFVIKAGRKMFNPLDLKGVFEKLKAFDTFYHVLLLNEKEEFVGYIPAETAKKDFMGENGETKITKFIVDVLADPKKSETLRTMRGAAQDDTVDESIDIRAAAQKMWVNEKVQTLIVMRRNKPIGVLDKQAVLTLTATGA
jgi:hypothetical protein